MSQDTGPREFDLGELTALTDSWVTHLQAERKSPHTIRTYTNGVTAFARWCDRNGIEPVLDRATVSKFTASLLAEGAEAATALSRQRGVRHFSRWLAAEAEIPADELAGMSPPKLDDKVPPALDDTQLRALLATCGVKDFHDIRDAAIIRLMAESMIRSAELLAMTTADVDIRAGTALVRRGKGGKGRLVPFGPQTGQAIDRYARTRRRHALAARPEFWLAERQRVMTYAALYNTLKRRGERIGVAVHPHMLRATGAIRWRAAGGSVPGLLTVAGWSTLEMAQRYVRAAESRLAVDEAHRLDLGDL
ncbi:MAG: tyrosine-type recombinase/integrase [Streptosporangiaceae bacterium]